MVELEIINKQSIVHIYIYISIHDVVEMTAE